MIIDSFLFFNEYDLLEKRLEYLYDTVDLFLIVEGNSTFAGNPKPLNFLANQSRFHKYLDKILYCPFYVDLTNYDFSLREKGEFFAIEIDQRNYIGSMLNFFPHNTIVLLGDLDEIPLKNKIREAIVGLEVNNFDSIVLNCDMFLYNFDQKQETQWCGPIACYNKYIQRVGAQWARSSRVYNAGINSGGYHLSYWTAPDLIKYKLENFAHTEYNKEEFTSVEKIKQRIASGTDIFDRKSGVNTLVKVNKEDIDQEIYRIFS